MMKYSWSACRAAVALIACIAPITAQAAVLYNQITVQNANGTVFASVTATPAQIAANPSATYYVSGVATDPTQHGNFATVVDDDGNPIEIFGPADGGPDGNDLAFSFQVTAAQYFVQNAYPDSGLPIDLTNYLDPGLQGQGVTATLLATEISAAVPEPLTWTLMAVGFGTIGAAVRRRPIAQRSFAVA